MFVFFNPSSYHKTNTYLDILGPIFCSIFYLGDPVVEISIICLHISATFVEINILSKHLYYQIRKLANYWLQTAQKKTITS